jgi:hypothetical protein
MPRMFIIFSFRLMPTIIKSTVIARRRAKARRRSNLYQQPLHSIKKTVSLLRRPVLFCAFMPHCLCTHVPLTHLTNLHSSGCQYLRFDQCLRPSPIPCSLFSNNRSSPKLIKKVFPGQYIYIVHPAGKGIVAYYYGFFYFIFL